MRVTQIISMLAVFWAGFVLGRAASDGFHFDHGGAYGNGQMAAIVLAVIVILVAGRQLIKPRRRAKPIRRA
jgi:hypothetical protein